MYLWDSVQQNQLLKLHVCSLDEIGATYKYQGHHLHCSIGKLSMHTHIHVLTHTHTCTHTYMYNVHTYIVHAHVHTYIVHAHAYTYAHTCIHICTHMHTHTHHIHVHTDMHTHVHTYTHTPTCIHTCTHTCYVLVQPYRCTTHTSNQSNHYRNIPELVVLVKMAFGIYFMIVQLVPLYLRLHRT